MFKWLGKLVDSNEKAIERLQPIVDEINGLEPEFQKLNDAELRGKTDEFRKFLAEQTVEINEHLTEARKELEEGKARLAAAEDEQQCQEETYKIKVLQDKLDDVEKEKRQIEAEALDDLLPEAFAAVREAARRTIGQRHYDVQLIGGIVLHQGKIAEMRTGEGKTLVATLPLYLNALPGKGCHLVTVNDYLARRDPYWMGPIFQALGLTVSSIFPQQSQDDFTPSRLYDPAFDSGDKRWVHFRPVTRQQAYKADITYGTSAEFGFDYLRDNMAVDMARCVQRLPLAYGIVDEVDNLLIDEARTPLIISGPAPQTASLYEYFAQLATKLNPVTDYEVKEKERSIEPTDEGYTKVERILKLEGVLKGESLYDPANVSLMHHLRNSLTAKEFYKRDQQYTVKDGEVLIVDEFTGHLMMGRRYSEGLHQAIEAKEHVKIQEETKTYATVTIQNYFRMYQKLAGMTGTAVTEAEEFHKIYKLEVVVIPTNKPAVREDFSDRIYKDQTSKFKAVVNEVVELNQQKRPILIGTVSIEKSEILSDMLKRRGVTHQVLNAKLHEKEGIIVAQAGRLGGVTVATNMAGRGVDIILGGSPDGREQKEWQAEHDKVLELGGLFVIGTERHESRRIDNQLRGRAGRQGDPGATRFYVSLDDDIVRRFGGDRIKGIMEWAGMDETVAIENKMVNKTIESAQVRVEGYNFDIRKSLVEYDDVVNQQRELIYRDRRKVLSGADLKTNILDMVEDEIRADVASHEGSGPDGEPDVTGLLTEINTIFPIPQEIKNEAPAMGQQALEDALVEASIDAYNKKEAEVTAPVMRQVERLVMLGIIDNLWVEHLTNMEHMRLQAGWEQLRQVKAIDAYKNQGYQQFQILEDTIQHDIAHTIFHVNVTRQEETPQTPVSPMTKVLPGGGKATQTNLEKSAGNKRIGRNDPCHCGSGKKYKHCHGK